MAGRRSWVILTFVLLGGCGDDTPPTERTDGGVTPMDATENRNSAGALFVVNGEGRRIDQRTSSDYEDDVWGERDLSGTVEVVLDSTMEDASDCVTEVLLEPIGG